jgi:hypothetical protein
VRREELRVVGEHGEERLGQREGRENEEVNAVSRQAA